MNSAAQFSRQHPHPHPPTSIWMGLLKQTQRGWQNSVGWGKKDAA